MAIFYLDAGAKQRRMIRALRDQQPIRGAVFARHKPRLPAPADFQSLPLANRVKAQAAMTADNLAVDGDYLARRLRREARQKIIKAAATDEANADAVFAIPIAKPRRARDGAHFAL